MGDRRPTQRSEVLETLVRKLTSDREEADDPGSALVGLAVVENCLPSYPFVHFGYRCKAGDQRLSWVVAGGSAEEVVVVLDGVYGFVFRVRGRGFDSWQAEAMEIEMTDRARKVLEKKGGVMSIDFIRPTG